MIYVSAEELVKAVQMAGDVASKGPTEPQRRVRVFANQGLHVMAMAGVLSTSRKIAPLTPSDYLMDALVQGDRLLACCKALRKGEVSICTTEGGLKIEQKDGIEVMLELTNVAEFPVVQPFDKMVHIYSGVNPSGGFEAIKHVAAAHPGSTPLANTLMMMMGRSYLASTMSSVRCDFSLVGVDLPQAVPITLESTWVLSHMKEQIACYDEPGRLLVTDSDGWVAIAKYAGELANFPKKVEQTFTSLKQIGQVKLPKTDALRAAIAAQTVLRGASKEPLYMVAECEDTKVKLSASVGRHQYKETVAGWSSGHYKIPLHVGRLIEFLRGSEDEAIYMRIMDSDILPAPMQFLHLIDSRLHEVVGLPGGYKIELIKT